MNLYQYQTGIEKFAMYPKDKELEYLTLGLFNEITEFYEKYNNEAILIDDLISELGDILWYTSRLHTHFNLPLTFNSNQENIILITNPLKHLIIEAGKIAGKVKKNLRDEKPVLITTQLDNILKYLYKLARNFDVNMEQLAQFNYDKLQDRFDRDVIKGDGDHR